MNVERKRGITTDSRNQESVSRIDETAPVDPKLVCDPEILRDGWFRAAAELDNLRKRWSVEIEAARKEERTHLLRAFLAVVDNLERALASDRAACANEDFVGGVRVVHEQLLSLLKHFGAEPIEVLGQPFDPNFHEAVTCVDLPDQPEGTVSGVIQTGYLLDGKHVLRPSRVCVVQHSGRRQ